MWLASPERRCDSSTMQHAAPFSHVSGVETVGVPLRVAACIAFASVVVGCSASSGSRGAGDMAEGGTSEPGQGAAPALAAADIGPLCDGSEDIRFSATMSSSALSNPYLQEFAYDAFVEAYGGSFLIIDGRCRFWRGRPETPIYSGTLDADEAASFAEAISFGRFRRWAGFVPVAGCDDGAGYALSAPDGTLIAQCDYREIPEADEDYERAFATSFDPGEVFTGEALTASAQLTTVPAPSAEFWHPPQPWPLDVPPTRFEALEFPITRDVGATITSPDQIITLRALRDAYLEQGGNGPGVRVLWRDPETSTDLYYDLLVRELLPADVLARWQGAGRRGTPEGSQ